LRRLGDVATPLVVAARSDLTANLRDLVPALRALSRAGDSLARGLGYAVTFPFPTDTVENTCASDYCNLFLTLDLTTDALIDGFVTPDGHLGIPGIPGLPVGLLQNLPGVSKLPILGPLLSRNSSGPGTVSPSSPAKTGSTDGDVMGDLLTGVLSLFGTRAGGGS
jgi:phospholipid/cholesterol/gamma-HCH transport system substrate-binding protein